jgi:hypothetical protein
MHSTTSSRSLADRGITSDALFVASLFSYVAALFTPAIGGVGGVCGLYALILGPLALLASEFSWLANIFLWGAWLARKKPKTLPVALAILALIVAGTFLLGHLVIPGRSNQNYIVGPGYWLWLASMVLAGASALIYVQPSAKVQSGAA